MAKEKDKKGAHGLSAKEAAQLHYLQVNNEATPKVAANGAESGGYKVEKSEEHLVHVELEIPNYDNATGAKLSKGFVQKYGVREFEAAKANGGFTGYATRVLHSPAQATQQMGVAVEGVRVIDSNYAVMQDAYEQLTGERPDETFTPAQLDAALRTARALSARLFGNQTAPAAIDQSAALSHVPGVVVNEATVAAVVVANDTEATDKKQVAEAAKTVGENTAPTQDGNTSVGQATTVADAADDADAPATHSGRRGAAVGTTRPSAK